MINALVFIIIFLLSVFGAFGQAASVSADDLKPLAGAWTGTLTYLGYGSGKKTSIRSDVKVTGDEPGAWTFEYIYPDEPKANGKSVVKLSSDGRTFNDQEVAEAKKLPDGTIRIVTTKPGTDNNRPALFRYTYIVGKSAFSISKEVRLEGSETFFERNTYSWTR
jgi:hypothetical protein